MGNIFEMAGSGKKIQEIFQGNISEKLGLGRKIKNIFSVQNFTDYNFFSTHFAVLLLFLLLFAPNNWNCTFLQHFKICREISLKLLILDGNLIENFSLENIQCLFQYFLVLGEKSMKVFLYRFSLPIVCFLTYFSIFSRII